MIRNTGIVSDEVDGGQVGYVDSVRSAEVVLSHRGHNERPLRERAILTDSGDAGT